MHSKKTLKNVKKHIKTVKNRPRKMSVFDGSFFAQKNGEKCLAYALFVYGCRNGKTFRAHR